MLLFEFDLIEIASMEDEGGEGVEEGGDFQENGMRRGGRAQVGKVSLDMMAGVIYIYIYRCDI